MDNHPIAAIFPLLEGDALKSLAEDIRKHGLKFPVITYEGKVLDGRNRSAACLLAEVTPRYEQFDGTPLEAIQYVWSVNHERRHLNSSQAAIAEEKRYRLCDEYAKQVDAMKAEAAKRPNAGRPKTGENSRQQIDANLLVDRTDAIRAKTAGTNRQYLAEARKLLDEHPEQVAAIEKGEKTITQVKRDLKDAEREQKRQLAAESIGNAPTIQEALKSAKFSTIVIDPPWDWGDEGDVSQFGRGNTTYGSMSREELLAFPVGDYADADAHIYLWITNRSLPKGFELLEAWGFRYVTCLTWCKPSIGMGNYFRGSTEQVLFGVRGSLPLSRKDVGTWFEAPRGGKHSEKPSKFYELVASCSPGPYLDIFARTAREGWTCWGGEL